jgi:hypothetical protein
LEKDLHLWFASYFGKYKGYICAPYRKDYDTQQVLMKEAWELFMKEKLYLKIGDLVTYEVFDNIDNSNP